MGRVVKDGKRLAAIFGRPDMLPIKGTEKKRYTLYLTKQGYEALTKICIRKGLTTSEMVDNLIADLLDTAP